VKSEGLREKIELIIRYQLKELFNDLKRYEQSDQRNELVQFLKEMTMVEIEIMLSDIKKFNNRTGDLSCFYWYMYELDENGEQRLISLDEEQCKDLPDISWI
jgi:hypothetical protein